MSVRLDPAQSFERPSPVCDYWLTRCAGFRVVTPDGRKGRVEAAVYEPSQSRVSHVFVRFRWRRDAAVVPADEVEAVVPGERLLVMGPGPAAEDGGVPSDPARVVGVLRRVALATSAAAAWAAPRAWRLARAIGNGLATASLAAARVTRRFAVWAAPHVARGSRSASAALAAATRTGARASVDAARVARRRIG